MGLASYAAILLALMDGLKKMETSNRSCLITKSAVIASSQKPRVKSRSQARFHFIALSDFWSSFLSAKDNDYRSSARRVKAQETEQEIE